jgi:peptide/nickel transport system permease protein
MAGSAGLLIGTILGFIAGYFGGRLDTVVRTAADVMLTIPTLAVLVVIASLMKDRLTPQSMAQVIALLAWHRRSWVASNDHLFPVLQNGNSYL